MELWIRSQDGESLAKVDRVELYDGLNNDWTLQCVFRVLGRYKTKERALQVLDAIQNILQPRVIYHEPTQVNDYHDMIDAYSNDVVLQTTQKVEMELKQAGQFVYQMPKE